MSFWNRLQAVADPFWPDYRVSGDREALAANTTNGLRAWSETALFNALDPDRIPERRKGPC
jgi:hypothetical protein